MDSTKPSFSIATDHNLCSLYSGCTTVWGGMFEKGNMFSESSPCLLGQHCSCSSAQLHVEVSEHILQNLFHNLPPQTVREFKFQVFCFVKFKCINNIERNTQVWAMRRPLPCHEARNFEKFTYTKDLYIFTRRNAFQNECDA